MIVASSRDHPLRSSRWTRWSGLRVRSGTPRQRRVHVTTTRSSTGRPSSSAGSTSPPGVASDGLNSTIATASTKPMKLAPAGPRTVDAGRTL